MPKPQGSPEEDQVGIIGAVGGFKIPILLGVREVCPQSDLA